MYVIHQEMSHEIDFPPPPVDIKKLRAHFETLQLGEDENTSLDTEFEVNFSKFATSRKKIF